MGNNPTALQMLAMREALKTAFLGSYFNVCGLSKACVLLGKNPSVTDPMDWELINSVHCVDWKDFSVEAKEELKERVGRVLGVSMDKLLPKSVS